MKTDPIKSKKDLNRLKLYFEKKGNMRDLALIVISVNTGLRCSDILELRWEDVYEFDTKKFKPYIHIVEKKTKKIIKIKMNKAVIDCLKKLKAYYGEIQKDGVLFKSQKGKNKAISRIQMYRILKQAAKFLKIQGNIACHSLRKTFGYNAFKKGVAPAVIMELFNHSSYAVTRRYLGIDQDEKDKVFMSLNL